MKQGADETFDSSSLCINVPSIAPWGVELCPPQATLKSNPRTSLNVTLFGSRVFEEVSS